MIQYAMKTDQLAKSSAIELLERTLRILNEGRVTLIK